jgi:hypothetical protein
MVALRTWSSTIFMGSDSINTQSVSCSSSKVSIIRGVPEVIVIVDIGSTRIRVGGSISCCVYCCSRTAWEGSIIHKSIIVSSLEMGSITIGSCSYKGRSYITCFDCYPIIRNVWGTRTRGSGSKDPIHCSGSAGRSHGRWI